MPVSVMDRLPLPKLKAYAAGSVAMVGVAVYHAVGVTSDPAWRTNATLQRPDAAVTASAVPSEFDLNAFNATRTLTEQAADVIAFMMQEPLCMWTLINMCYCSLAVVAACVRRAVFGTLRVAESQRLKDRLWNYVFYKFIFVFGVINVQYMDEVLLWCSWFTLVGFLNLLAHLCKDRYEYMSVWGGGVGGVGTGVGSGGGGGGGSAVVAGGSGGGGVVCTAAAAGAGCAALLAAAARSVLPLSSHTFAFMAAEVVIVVVVSLHVVAGWALRRADADADADAAAPLHYYTHLAFDCAGLGVEVCHVSHMVWWSRLVVSMPSLVLLMQLRHLLHELQLRLRKHRSYTALANHMSRNYPMASREEVSLAQDKCAICWEPMKEARKLPCHHLFHNSCLCQWVQQDASCPTCRRALGAHPPATPAAVTSPPPPPPPPPPLPPGPATAQPDHLFRFDGSRYVSWLPSFSVEVTRVRAPPDRALDDMLHQVLSVFPGLGAGAVLQDLRATRDADHTIHNILEGRLHHDIYTHEPPVVEASGAVSPAPAAHPPQPPPQPPPQHPPLELELEDAVPAEEPTPPASFPVMASERETGLRRRKQQLLAAARQRYIRRHANANANTPRQHTHTTHTTGSIHTTHTTPSDPH